MKIVTCLFLSLLLMAVPAMAESVSLPAAEASFTSGKGVSADNKKVAAGYDSSLGLIINLADGAEVTYTVPETAAGTVDIYLTVSKILSQFTSQPFAFRINDGEEFSVEIDCQVSADSIAANHKDGDDYNVGYIYDTGVFPILQGVTLHAGDKITVIARYGAKASMLKGKFYPGVGDMILAESGAQIPVGYDAVIPAREEVDPSDPLSGKTIFWLGSSVTYGASAAGHYSMVDAIEALHPALNCEKYAISATTLVNTGDDSYVGRLVRIPKQKRADLIVVQLSTNDATTGKPFGQISESFDMADFDDQTIAGAIEFIIAYAKETFNCPVAFYTGSFCEKENYAEMVQLLLKIQEKWDICVIDMFNNAEMTAIFNTDLYNSYMSDQVHPNRKGYIEWWTPVIDAELTAYMSSRK